MDTAVLPFLRCTGCGGALVLQDAHYEHSGEVVAGSLWCPVDLVAFPIRDGIVDFLGPPRPFSLAQRINELPPTAWAYERLWRPFALTLFSGERFPYLRELPMLIAMTEPQRGGLWLDIACGNGLYARALARASRGDAVVVALEHALPMLAQGRRYVRSAGLRVTFVRASAQALPFAPAAAAGAVIGGSLNEIGDLDTCLAEVARVLSPTGRFVAMTLVRGRSKLGRFVQRLLGWGGIVFWSPDELRARMQHHGLQLRSMWRYGIVLFTLCLPRRVGDSHALQDGIQ